MTDLKGKLVFSAYRAGVRVAQALPESTLGAIGKYGGRLGGYPQRNNRRMAARHQARVRGYVDPHAVDQVFENYGRYWLEILRLPIEVDHDNIASHFEVTGYEHIEHALAAGNGIVLALPHLGGWEWAAAWMSSLGYHMLAVVEALEPPELLEWFAHQREAYGLEVVALGPDVSTRVLKALRENRIVCLLCDRDLTGDGVEVEFFGESHHLARRTRDARVANRRRDPSDGRVLPSRAGPSRRHRGADRHRPFGSSARRRPAHHPGDRAPLRGADPQGARAVASLAAQLAQRPVVGEAGLLEGRNGVALLHVAARWGAGSSTRARARTAQARRRRAHRRALRRTPARPVDRERRPERGMGVEWFGRANRARAA